MKLNNLQIRFNTENAFTPYYLFEQKFGYLPHHRVALQGASAFCDYEKVIGEFLNSLKGADYFSCKSNNIDINNMQKPDEKFVVNSYKLETWVVEYEDNHFVIEAMQRAHGSSGISTITFYYAENNSSRIPDFINIIADKMRAYGKDERKSVLNIISFDREFYLNSFEMSEPKESRVEFDDCYNEDFLATKEFILNSLRTDSKGIVLLHGEAGTGKTTFLRHIISSCQDKKVIYMPPDLTHRISSPEFITFLMENSNSVILIEDAENVLKAREAGGDQAVSNLLNASDGILGDALKMQIICTFNCPKNEIDSALMRPGRLIAEYRFGRLSVDRTAALVRKLYGEDVVPEKDEMTIAEIFNMTVEKHKSTEKKKKLGFY